MVYIFCQGSIIKARKGFQNSDGTMNDKKIGAYLRKFKEPINEMNDVYRETDPVLNRNFVCGTLSSPANPRDKAMVSSLLRDEIDNSRLASDEAVEDRNLCFGRVRKRTNA